MPQGRDLVVRVLSLGAVSDLCGPLRSLADLPALLLELLLRGLPDGSWVSTLVAHGPQSAKVPVCSLGGAQGNAG